MFPTNEAVTATTGDLLLINIKPSKLKETDETKVNTSRNATHSKQKSIIEFVCPKSQNNETPADSPTSPNKRKRSEKVESENKLSDLLLEAVNKYKQFEKQTFSELTKKKSLSCAATHCRTTEFEDRGPSGCINTFGFREKSIRCKNLSCSTSSRLRLAVERNPDFATYAEQYSQLDKELTAAAAGTHSMGRKQKQARLQDNEASSSSTPAPPSHLEDDGISSSPLSVPEGTEPTSKNELINTFNETQRKIVEPSKSRFQSSGSESAKWKAMETKIENMNTRLAQMEADCARLAQLEKEVKKLKMEKEKYVRENDELRKEVARLGANSKPHNKKCEPSRLEGTKNGNEPGQKMMVAMQSVGTEKETENTETWVEVVRRNLPKQPAKPEPPKKQFLSRAEKAMQQIRNFDHTKSEGAATTFLNLPIKDNMDMDRPVSDIKLRVFYIMTRFKWETLKNATV